MRQTKKKPTWQREEHVQSPENGKNSVCLRIRKETRMAIVRNVREYISLDHVGWVDSGQEFGFSSK